MEFIENHFYKLTKEMPKKQSCEMPAWFNGAYYGIYGSSVYNSYGSYTISSYDGTRNMIISQVNPYEACKRFTIDNTYQAASSTSLYDDTNIPFTLDKEEIECFEEVDIGLSEISKKFMEKHISSGKMLFNFRFYNDNMVIFNISLNGKYHTTVSLMGIIDEINEIIHKGYTELRKSYIKKFKYYLEVNHRWARLIDNSYYGPESRGIFGGQL
jgi:hypothetical protein